jgi:antitoxin component HigA of HigAB toxin-antitoxin module
MLKPVKTKKDYDTALKRCYELMQKDVKANLKIADELEVLFILIKNYEEKHYPAFLRPILLKLSGSDWNKAGLMKRN